jgi:hypothetical protein
LRQQLASQQVEMERLGTRLGQALMLVERLRMRVRILRIELEYATSMQEDLNKQLRNLKVQNDLLQHNDRKSKRRVQDLEAEVARQNERERALVAEVSSASDRALALNTRLHTLAEENAQLRRTLQVDAPREARSGGARALGGRGSSADVVVAVGARGGAGDGGGGTARRGDVRETVSLPPTPPSPPEAGPAKAADPTVQRR